MKTTSRAIPVRDIGSTLSGLLKTQFRLGTQLLDIMSQVQIPRNKSCCDIPEPCWMPVSLGEIESYACEGANVVVRIMITNCDRVPRNYTISATGVDAELVDLQPTTLTIGAKERGRFVATLKIPVSEKRRPDFEVLLWVRGCKEYYLRWTVAVGTTGGDCCYEAIVEDCPDLVHHWYDHFYCVRPCFFDRKSKDTYD